MLGRRASLLAWDSNFMRRICVFRRKSGTTDGCKKALGSSGQPYVPSATKWISCWESDLDLRIPDREWEVGIKIRNADYGECVCLNFHLIACRLVNRAHTYRPLLGFQVANRTELFDNAIVKGSEFLRKVKVVARRKKLTYRWAAERGSGSHGTLYLGSRFTVVKDLKKEIGPGLLSDMLKQLG